MLRGKGHYAESAQLPPVLAIGPGLRGAAASKGLPSILPRISCQPVCVQEEVPTQAVIHLPAPPGTENIMIPRAAPRSLGDIQDRAESSSATAGMH
eukprot:9395317-Pyramimonas_sp.AAC.1